MRSVLAPNERPLDVSPKTHELALAIVGMFNAADEIAVEFIEHKRATKWDVVNDAYCLASKALVSAGYKMRTEGKLQ